jgi:hypothetical protein
MRKEEGEGEKRVYVCGNKGLCVAREGRRMARICWRGGEAGGGAGVGSRRHVTVD